MCQVCQVSQRQEVVASMGNMICSESPANSFKWTLAVVNIWPQGLYVGSLPPSLALFPFLTHTFSSVTPSLSHLLSHTHPLPSSLFLSFPLLFSISSLSCHSFPFFLLPLSFSPTFPLSLHSSPPTPFSLFSPPPFLDSSPFPLCLFPSYLLLLIFLILYFSLPLVSPPDVELADWQPQTDGTKLRDLSYTLALNYSFGPKYSPSTEHQVYSKHGQPGLKHIVDTEVCTCMLVSFPCMLAPFPCMLVPFPSMLLPFPCMLVLFPCRLVPFPFLCMLDC